MRPGRSLSIQSLSQGKNTTKPVRAVKSSGGGPDLDESTEKAFHSSAFEQERLNTLINAPERQTWEEFKETLRKKGEMDGDVSRAEEEAQRRFRKELDAARAERLGGGGGGEADGGGSTKKRKKDRKEKRRKKSKKDKREKKKRRRDESGEESESGSSGGKDKKVKRGKSSKEEGGSGAPVKLSAFFNASSSDSES
jgi:hypothetical protein